jgi:hypothetical protein
VPIGNEWVANTIISPTSDSDSGLAESLSGTDPFDSTSTLEITGITHFSTSNKVTWSRVPGKIYGVEYLNSPSSFQDTDAAHVSDDSRIYRIVLI